MNILLVARDPNPSLAFQKVGIQALSTGHNVCTVLGNGKDIGLIPAMINRFVEWSDVVLVGMSSTSAFATFEIQVCDVAIKIGAPFALFSDTFECWRRQHFADVRGSAQYLFVSSEAEVLAARELLPTTTIVSTGNPMWEDLLIRCGRDEARRLLNVKGKMVVVCPGNKAEPSDPPNKNVQLVRAVHGAYPHQDVRVVFHPHPGDRADDAYYAHHLAGVANVVSRSDREAKSQWVRAADAVISACSPSTDLQALLHKVPCVNILDDEIRARLQKEFDDDVPPMVRCGYVTQADMNNPESIREALALAYGRMRWGGMVLPEITQGASAKKIVDTVRAGF